MLMLNVNSIAAFDPPEIDYTARMDIWRENLLGEGGKVKAMGGAVLGWVLGVSLALSAEPAIERWEGNGAQNTRPFTATTPWEIQWAAQGALFQVSVYSPDGKLLALIANQTGPGDGRSYYPRAGTYYLGVNALGAWRMMVVAVPPPGR